MSKITGYTALTTGFSTSDIVPIVDVSDTTMAASGTTKKITVGNLADAVSSNTDTNIAANGAQAAGAVGLAADAGHVHPATGQWLPSDNGLLAASAPLPAADGGQTANAGNLYLLKVWIRQPFTATNLWLNISTAGSGASTQSFCGIWNSSGTLLTGSSDIGASFNSGSARAQSVAWTTPQSLTVGMNFVWVGFVFNLATTQPTLRTLTSNNPTVMNTNLTAATAAVAVNGLSVTSLTNITPSSNNASGTPQPYWCGIS